MSHLLDVRDLAVSFRGLHGPVPAVLDVSLHLDPGELVCIVGESGSGKSVTAMSLLGLTRAQGATVSGAVDFDGRDLLSADETYLRSVRGGRIGFVFQDAMTALDPVQRVGAQIAEQHRLHSRVSRREAHAEAVRLMERVGIPQAARRSRAYPHEFSGGMCQRIMIAIALACGPEVIIADEPTTALDVTIQAQILVELRRLCQEEGIGVLLITHDLGVVAEVADRVVVMYAGRVVEEGTVADVFNAPRHPYTRGLLASTPRIDLPRRGSLDAISGSPASTGSVPSGCSFRPRCGYRFDRCEELPPLTDADGSSRHRARCWLPASELTPVAPSTEQTSR